MKIDPEQRTFPAPDLSYVLKALKRQWRLAVALGCLTLIGGSLVTAKLSNVYSSTVTAAIDRHDALELGYAAGSGLDQVVGNNFAVLFSSDDFLLEVAKSMGLDPKVAVLSHWQKWLGGIRLKTKIVLAGIGIGKAPVESEARINELALAADLQQHLHVVVEGAGNILTLITYGDSPEQVQDLAAHGMETFIRSELQAEAAAAKLKSEFLRLALINEKKSLKGEGPAVPTAPALSPDAELRLKERETQLKDEIRLREGDLANVSAEYARHRINLELDLERLASLYTAHHPEVTAKRQELEALAKAENPAVPIEARLAELRHQAWEVRRQQLYPLGAAAAGDGTSSDDRALGSIIYSLAEKIRELELDQATVERQANDPDLRTRLKVIKSATYSTRPLTNIKRKAAAGTVFLALLMTAFTLVFREVKNPLARDAWRVAWQTKCPVLTQVSTASLEAYPHISPAMADNMRAALGKTPGSADVEAMSRTLLAYRSLELAIRNGCRGRLVHVTGIMSSPTVAAFFDSFLNVYATDVGAPVLLVDCNHLVPIPVHVAAAVGQNPGPGNLGDLLATIAKTGTADWRKSLQPSSAERAYDAILPPVVYTGERTRLLQEKHLKTLLALLTPHYAYIFVHGLPESHFIENDALTAATSDTLVLVDCAQASVPKVRRALQQLRADAVRGLVMLGT